MKRALVEALRARERALEAREAMRPTLVLTPGQEAPAGWDGDVIEVRVIDGRKPQEA